MLGAPLRSLYPSPCDILVFPCRSYQRRRGTWSVCGVGILLFGLLNTLGQVMFPAGLFVISVPPMALLRLSVLSVCSDGRHDDAPRTEIPRLAGITGRACADGCPSSCAAAAALRCNCRISGRLAPITDLVISRCLSIASPVWPGATLAWPGAISSASPPISSSPSSPSAFCTSAACSLRRGLLAATAGCGDLRVARGTPPVSTSCC